MLIASVDRPNNGGGIAMLIVELASASYISSLQSQKIMTMPLHMTVDNVILTRMVRG